MRIRDWVGWWAFLLALGVAWLCFCSGCRSGLDLATAQTAHVVRVEASRFADVYGNRAMEGEVQAFDRAVDETFANLEAGKTTPAQVRELVKAAARQRDAQMQVIRTDVERFYGYMDMLKLIESGYTTLYSQQQALKAQITGQPALAPVMPDTRMGGNE